MIVFDQLVSMDAIPGFPRIVAVGIAFPLQEIFQLPLSPFESVINDGFYFIFVLSSDQFGWRSDEVRTM
jgi:hypothetical protein